MTVSSMESTGSPLDYEIELAAGRVPGQSLEIKFGERNNPTSTIGVFDDVWEGPTGIYVPPTQARVHDLVSDNIEDDGTLVSSGTITTESTSKIIDLAATFQTDGVAVGDLVFNDDQVTYAIGGVVSIDSETELTIEFMAFPESGLQNGVNSVGDAYRVARPAATGASSVLIVGLDADWMQIEEFVILNGIAPVPTTKSYLRQFRMIIFGAGSAQINVGSITSTAQADATMSCIITPSHNQSLMAIYTVPADKIGYISTWNASLSRKVSATAEIHLRTGRLDGVGRVRRHGSIGTTGQGGFDSPFGPLTIPPKTDVWQQVDVDTNLSGVTGGFRVVLEDIT